MQVLQYQVSTPQSTIAADVAQHYVPPPPYFGNSKMEHFYFYLRSPATPHHTTSDTVQVSRNFFDT